VVVDTIFYKRPRQFYKIHNLGAFGDNDEPIRFDVKWPNVKVATVVKNPLLVPFCRHRIVHDHSLN